MRRLKHITSIPPNAQKELVELGKSVANAVTEIRNSKFLVADVTEHKRGVYFEAGYALGFGLPVIWTVRHDELSKTHFDTRQYNHIVWQTPTELKEQLYLVICAVIGKNK